MVWLQVLIGVLVVSSVAGAADKPAEAKTDGAVLEARHLGNIQRVTFGLPRAGEGYFSPDGKWVVYQAYPVGYPFYQIYVQKLGEKTTRRVSTGRGRTTCLHPVTPIHRSSGPSSRHANWQPGAVVVGTSGTLTSTWTSTSAISTARA